MGKADADAKMLRRRSAACRGPADEDSHLKEELLSEKLQPRRDPSTSSEGAGERRILKRLIHSRSKRIEKFNLNLNLNLN